MSKLFGTDGIRAKWGTWPLTLDFISRLGQIAGQVICKAQGSTIVIGRDTRSSSIVIQSAIVAGLLDSGTHVIDLGILPTPAVSWAVRQLNAEAGIVVSASHNPADENGIKFFGNGGQKFPERLEIEIENLHLNTQYNPTSSPTPGILLDGSSLHELYVRNLINEHHSPSAKKLLVLADCANGASSYLAADILSRYGVEVISINSTPNGVNINKNAGSEFVRRNVDQFATLVKSFGANIGISFDGDADRVVFVDEKGRLVDGDHMLGILAKYFDDQGILLKRSVVTTVMRNNGLKVFLENNKIEVYETPVGDKHVTEQLVHLARNNMEDNQTIGLGGEQSGHVVLYDLNHMTGDGIRTALYVLDAYFTSGARSLAELADNVGKTPQVVASAYTGNGPKLTQEQIRDLELELRETHPDILRSNLRYSGTEPLFRVMLEGSHHIDIKSLATIAHNVCKKIQAVAKCTGSIDILNSTHGGVINIDHS